MKYAVSFQIVYKGKGALHIANLIEAESLEEARDKARAKIARHEVFKDQRGSITLHIYENDQSYYHELFIKSEL